MGRTTGKHRVGDGPGSRDGRGVRPGPPPGKPCEYTANSHINMSGYDSTWEASEAFELDRNPLVESWVKNDHLGYEVLYVYRGVVRKYRPDFIIRYRSGNMLALETKGQQDGQSHAKRRALEQWVEAVNQHGGFGHWSAAVSTNPADIKDILARHGQQRVILPKRSTIKSC